MRFLFIVVLFTAFLIPSKAFTQNVERLIGKGKLERAKSISFSRLKRYQKKDSVFFSTHKYTLLALTKRTNNFHNLGRIYQLEGNYRKAQEYYSQADQTYLKLTLEPLPVSFSDFLYRSTIIFKFLVGHDNTSVQEQKNFIRQVELANIHRQLGQMDQAHKLIDLTLFQAGRSYKQNTSIANYPYAALADYHQQLGNYDSSRISYELYIRAYYGDPNSFDFNIKKLADAYAGLSESYMSLKRPEQAMAAAKKSWKFSRHRFVRYTDGRNYLGKIRAANLVAENYRLQKNYTKATQWSDKAYRISNRIPDHLPEKLAVVATRGQLFWAKSDTTTANRCFKELSDIFFHVTQNNFSYLTDSEREYFYRSSRHYLDLVKGYYTFLYFNKGYQQEYIANRLYEVHVNNEGVLLNAASKLYRASVLQGNAYMFFQLTSLRRQKANLLSSGDFKYLKNINNQIETSEQILRASLSLEPERYVTTNDVVNAISDSTHFIDIVRYKDFSQEGQNGMIELVENGGIKYCSFVFTKNAPIRLVQNPFDENILENRGYKGFLNAAKFDIRQDDAYKTYFEPWKQHLQFRKIVIASDGIYNLINPEILFDGRDYLFNQYSFKFAVSAKDVLRSLQKAPVLKDITLVGWPDYSTHLKRYTISPKELPGTESEINGIVKLLPQEISKTILVREGANEKRLQEAPSTSVLHFATHGFFENDSGKDPMHSSGLVLAIEESQTNHEDGFLTAFEASNLELKNTFLVVLSACETGQGEFEGGEGVWGLQRAFQVAGVQYILMSLFKVDDQITAALMQYFYTNLAGGQSVETAFKNAQLKIRSEYSKPLDWGSFLLKGF